MTVTTSSGDNGSDAGREQLRLADVALSQEVELVGFDLPEHQLEALLERGVLPGCRLCPVRHSPSGDPIVRVEGCLLALRREMAGCLLVREMAEENAA